MKQRYILIKGVQEDFEKNMSLAWDEGYRPVGERTIDHSWGKPFFYQGMVLLKLNINGTEFNLYRGDEDKLSPLEKVAKVQEASLVDLDEVQTIQAPDWCQLAITNAAEKLRAHRMLWFEQSLPCVCGGKHLIEGEEVGSGYSVCGSGVEIYTKRQFLCGDCKKVILTETFDGEKYSWEVSGMGRQRLNLRGKEAPFPLREHDHR